MIDIAGLKKNVGFLNWATGIIFVSGLTAIILSYLLLAGRIDDRYDKIGTKLDHVGDQITDLRVSVSEIGKSDDKSSSGSKREQAGPVRR